MKRFFLILASLLAISSYAQTNSELKAELEHILETDQAPRNEYVAALRAVPQDSVLIKKLIKTIVFNDSVNTIRVTGILDTYGFPSLKEVGEVNIAIWAVIQHSSIELIDKYISVFMDAAEKGELPKMYVATMYDRCEAWHNRPQKYGTQGNMDENGIFVPYTLLDPAKVDEWRKEMDLAPIAEYIRQMSKK